MVKPGYKQTEVGVIPEDWEVIYLGEIADVKTGPFGSALHERDYVEDGTPIITVEHLGDQGVDHTNLPQVSGEDLYRLKSYILKENDLVFSRVGSIDRNALIRREESGWLFSGRLLRVRLQDVRNFAPYISYHFHSEPFKQRIRSVAVGQTMPSLNTQILNGIRVVLPTSKEQRAIAEALSDVDALIAALDKLIAKKRAVKTAAMQQLLTGRIRLPGFGGEWIEKQIIELVDNKKELFNDGDWIEAEHILESGIRLLQTGNIGIGVFLEKGSKKYISQDSFDLLHCKLIFPGDILICRLAYPAGRACFIPNIGEEKIITAVDVTIFRPLSEYADPRYLLQLFSTKWWFDKVELRSGGSTRSRIARGELGRIVVNIPLVNEQQAIADILSDMDMEIATLETRREKTNAVKQGMLQELLTGKTRLLD